MAQFVPLDRENNIIGIILKEKKLNHIYSSYKILLNNRFEFEN